MNILDIVQKHVTLHKSGAHMVGPCPKCGGNQDTTRFVVNLAKNFAQCYSCGGNWDVVHFLRNIEGLSCPEAHRVAGMECDHSSCPFREKCSFIQGDKKPKDVSRPTPRISEPARQTFTPSLPDVPSDAWQHHAGEYVELCHQRLLACPEQLNYLGGRGLPREAVEKYRIGWIPQIEFKKRSAWGLADKWNEKEQRAITSMAFPQGILLPWIVGGYIHRLRLRKTIVTGPTDPRYLWIDGSGSDIICLNHSAQAHVVVESDLDGLLLDWLAGDIVGASALGSCSTKPKASIIGLLRSSLRILVALDYDHEQRDEKLHAPGARAAHWWFREFPDTAKRWPVPQGKDPGEAFAAGCDLRAWVIDGLPIALKVKALRPVAVDNDPEKNPEKIDTPEGRELLEPEPETPLPVVTRTAKDGRTFHITENKTEYARLVAAGEIVFDFAEMELVIKSGADTKQAAYFLTAKQTFPGIRLADVILEPPKEQP